MSTDVHECVELEKRITRYRSAARLLQQWLEQDDRYDEQVWKELEPSLTHSRTVCREDGDDSAA